MDGQRFPNYTPFGGQRVSIGVLRCLLYLQENFGQLTNKSLHNINKGGLVIINIPMVIFKTKTQY